ncbi:MAG: PIN domain-containing protein [Methanomassiliicoccales archaeon]|nr:MAG: PIN domain-containing protein [Methanomassiliicoccales archaeon]
MELKKAYLDTNIFLIFLEEEISNSELVIEAANEGLFIPVVSFHTFKEIMHNIKSRYSKDTASWMRTLIWTVQGLNIVSKEEINSIGDRYRELVDDEDDLPHINAYSALKCSYFVTTNRRLTQMKINRIVNFISPRDFLLELDLEVLDNKDGI